MISKFLVFIFLILSCFYSIISSEIYLDCYYNKYILYNLNTKVIYFNKIVSVNTPSHVLIEKFASGLQFLGPIVVAMLQQIEDEHRVKRNEIEKTIKSWSTNAFKNSQGLLFTNFYLNNLSNTLLLQTYQNVTYQTRELSDHEIFIDEFKKIYPNLIAQLKQNVLDACYEGNLINFSNIFIRNHQFIRGNYFIEIINDILPNSETIKTIFMENNIEQTMNKVQDTESNLRAFFKIQFEDEIMKNISYHPIEMLFSSLFDVSKRDKLNEIIEVRINEKLENGKYPNMAVLFDMIKHTFDVDCVESFQRQIVAATVYPYYVCVAKFALVLKKIIFGVYTYETEVISRVILHKDIISNTGLFLRNVIDQLICKIDLPNSVVNHLEATNVLLLGIVELVRSQNIYKFKSGYLKQLYWRCANTMKLNLIKFDIKVDNPDTYEKYECDEILSQLNNKIITIKSLTESLKNEYWLFLYFSQTLKVFSFNDMFSEELKCNIVQRNKEGYFIMGKE
ncbi:uncharacterized protein LOC126905197 isoform X1 [Daktulosphaira vitifoliae]|uniref:uncharacterized protein LOC126905197 isoform X1 n=1 Tax=Daktulosphaira vitifoliae TaxID=58002 RepID=UPI0021AA6C7A|nr:uncharacterized protein LOC126905197 isoform X1 [Daktulosphaira vitifoliae]